MHRVTTTTVVGMLALTTGGCSWGGLNSNSSTRQPTVKLATKPELKPAPVSFQKSLIIPPNPPTKVGSGSTGLVGLTDGKQYVKQVQQGRSDPFARAFTVPPEIAAKPQITIPKPPKLIAQELPPPPSPPQLKAVPSPDLARGVAVQGIIETSKGLHAIVQLPNEATSRYVSVGQQLSNGQISIKKINISSTSEPVVVLEQHGIEVAKAVGEEPAKPNDTKQPTATIPASQVVASNSSSEVSSQPPQTQAPVVKFGSNPKVYSKLLKVPSLPSSKKSLRAREYTNVAQASSASLELPSPPNHVATSSPDPVAISPEAILPKTQPSSSGQQDEQQVSSRSPNLLTSSNHSNAVELDERASQYKRLISRLRKPSASPDSSPVAEATTRAARDQQLTSRLSKPLELPMSSSTAEIDEQSAYYRDLISRLRKQR